MNVMCCLLAHTLHAALHAALHAVMASAAGASPVGADAMYESRSLSRLAGSYTVGQGRVPIPNMAQLEHLAIRYTLVSITPCCALKVTANDV